MALQTSGQISIYDIRTELGLTGQLGLTDLDARNLCGINTGQISLFDFYGKSAVPPSAAGIWTSTGNYPYVAGFVEGFGDNTSAVGFCGSVNGNVTSNYSAKFNGSSWASTAVYPYGIYNGAGAGTTLSGLGMGGSSTFGGPTSVYKFNGTSWASSTSYPLSAASNAAIGPNQNDVLSFCGYYNSTTYYNNTYYFNGTSWVAKSNYLKSLSYIAESGTPVDSIGVGGWNYTAFATNSAYKFNGTSWSSIAVDLLTTWGAGGTGTGFIDTFVWAGGGIVQGTVYSGTRFFNGTSWAYKNNYPLSLFGVGSGGTVSSTSLGLSFGGGKGSAAPYTFYNNTYKLS